MILFYLLSIVILLCFSAFFSGTETAIFSLSKIHIKRIQQKYPRKTIPLINLLNKPSKTLNTILVGNTLVNIAASALMTNLFIKLFGIKGVPLSVVVMSLVVLVFGEVTPKIFAINFAEKVARYVANFISILSYILFPIQFLCTKISNLIIQVITRNKFHTQPYITEDELKTLIEIGEDEGIIDQDEEKMLTTVIELGERYVNEIMTPHVDIVSIDIDESSQDLINLMKESCHSKIPVYKESIDDLVGVIYSKEYLLNPIEKWQTMIRPIYIIPETKKIDDLLTEFRTKKVALAMAVDEFGGTSGLVTLEDIMEEIVGEIRSEYDLEEDSIKKVGNKIFIVRGDTILKEVEELLGLTFDTHEVETLGGFVMQFLGKIPENGDFFEFKDHQFIINNVDKNRVRYVTIKKTNT